MSRRRLLLILLAACTVLASCGTAAQQTAADAPDVAVTQADDNSQPSGTEAPEYVRPDVDFDGREFLFSTWITDKPNWVATSYCEVVADEQNGDIINDAIYTRILNTEEALGVDVVANPYRKVAEFTNSAMAGDHFADTILLDGGSVPTMINSQLIQDLNTISTLQLDRSWWDQHSIEALTMGSHLFFASGGIGAFDQLSVFCTYFNKQIVADMSLDDPYAAVRGGTWTVDLLEKMARAAAADLDGDGEIGRDDRFGLSGEPGLLTVILRSAGVRFTTRNSSGEPEFTLNTERAATVVEKAVPLLRDRSVALYAGDWSSGYTNVFSQFITPTFIADRLLFVNNWLCVALELRNMESDFGILPPAKLDEQQDSYYVPSSESWTYYAMVPVTVTDLDFTGYVMDALGYYGRTEITTALIEKTITGKTLRDEDTGEMLNIIFDNRCYDPAPLWNWGGLNSVLGAFVAERSTAFASTIAANEAKIVAAIAETVDALC